LAYNKHVYQNSNPTHRANATVAIRSIMCIRCRKFPNFDKIVNYLSYIFNLHMSNIAPARNRK